MHDLRHQALTELAEHGASDDVMMALAGRLSERMRRHYVHVRSQAKQKAVAVLGLACWLTKPQSRTQGWTQTVEKRLTGSCNLLILWWAVQDSNLRPPACKAGALTG